MSGFDWGAIKEIAYGPLNLNPEQLGVLTVGEILDMYEGWKWRDKRKMEQKAQLASWITAPHLKRPIDPRKLMQENKPKVKTTPEKTKKVISELEELMGVI